MSSNHNTYQYFSDTDLRRELIRYLMQFVNDQRFDRLLSVLNQRTRHVTVILENLFQTQNASAVLRSCECYGVQDVHVVENDYEFQIHSAITMGSDKWLTVHRYNSVNQDNLTACVDSLKNKGFSIVATLPNDDSLFLDELSVEQPVAFLFGTELEGLSKEAIAVADKTVKIPMYGFTESFNISNAVAIILSHFIERIKKSSVKSTLMEEEKEELLLEWLQKSIKRPDLLINHFFKSKNLDI